MLENFGAAFPEIYMNASLKARIHIQPAVLLIPDVLALGMVCFNTAPGRMVRLSHQRSHL